MTPQGRGQHDEDPSSSENCAAAFHGPGGHTLGGHARAPRRTRQRAHGPTEISRRLRLPKSTVANLCAALERAELVRNVGGRYELGPRLLELSAAYLSKVDIFQEFHGACRQLRWLSQEVVNMASLEDTDILILARHYGSQSVMLSAGIGHRQAAYTRPSARRCSPGWTRSRWRRGTRARGRSWS